MTVAEFLHVGYVVGVVWLAVLTVTLCVAAIVSVSDRRMR